MRKLQQHTATLLNGVALFFFSIFIATHSAANDVSTSNSATPPDTISNQAELFHSIQVLQQEVTQLRGLVEEQAHAIAQLQARSLERYQDMDRRLADLSVNTTTNTSTNIPTSKPTAGAQAVNTPTALDNNTDDQNADDQEKQAYNAAYNLMMRKRFDSALQAFEVFLLTYPNNRYTPNALYWLGELYQIVNPPDPNKSEQAFNEVIDRYPESHKAKDAQTRLQALSQQNR